MSTELQTVDSPSALTSLSLGQLWKLSKMLIGTGFLPQEIKTPEQALAVMTKGQELRIPPMYALSNIVVVKGKPTCSAELMLALIRRDYGPRAIRIAETTNDHCTVEWRQEGWDGIQSYTFSMHDAQVAGLAGQPTWQKYPAALLRARCISAVARMAFPECIAGMYGPDELSPDVGVTDDGEVVIGSDAKQPAREVDIGQFVQDAIRPEPPKQLPAAASGQTRPPADTVSHAAAQDDDEPPSVHAFTADEADLNAALEAAPLPGAPSPIRFRRNATGMSEFIKLVEMSRPRGLGLDADARKAALNGKSVNGYMEQQGWQDEPAALDRVWAELERKVKATEAAEVAATE